MYFSVQKKIKINKNMKNSQPRLKRINFSSIHITEIDINKDHIKRIIIPMISYSWNCL